MKLILFISEYYRCFFIIVMVIVVSWLNSAYVNVSGSRCCCKKPEFTDKKVMAGKEYEYRVTAENAGGESEPSEVSSPIKAKPLKGHSLAVYLLIPHVCFFVTLQVTTTYRMCRLLLLVLLS